MVVEETSEAKAKLLLAELDRRTQRLASLRRRLRNRSATGVLLLLLLAVIVIFYQTPLILIPAFFLLVVCLWLIRIQDGIEILTQRVDALPEASAGQRGAGRAILRPQSSQTNHSLAHHSSGR